MSATALAGSSSALLASEAVDASIAQDAVCKMVLEKYNAQTAKVDSMKEYAECVQRIYPDEMSDEMTIAIKILICFAFAGAIRGLFMPAFDGLDRATNAVFVAIGFVAAPTLIALIVYAIGFLFS